MTQFVFTELVNSPHADIVSAALGVNSAGKFGPNDIGKPVKLAANDNYVLCALNDPIHGFVETVEGITVKDGFSFGSVRRNVRKVCQVDAAQTGAAPVGQTMVAGTSAALGTIDVNPQVTKIDIVGATDQVLDLWRVILVISGTGVAGDLVLIENV
jgi:hypothetical protein